jgi:hypothetical protein
MTGVLRDLTINRDGTQNVTVTVNSDFSRAYEALKGKPVTVEIKKQSKGRSRDANAFCWALCSDIGKAMTPPIAKEEIYRTAIKAAGVYWQTTIPAFDIETVRRRWEDRGTGWFVEVVDDDKPGRKLVHLYCGSSCYTVDEMRVLLDWLIDQAQQMEISIPLSKHEEEDLLERWGKR